MGKFLFLKSAKSQPLGPSVWQWPKPNLWNKIDGLFFTATFNRWKVVMSKWMHNLSKQTNQRKSFAISLFLFNCHFAAPGNPESLIKIAYLWNFVNTKELFPNCSPEQTARQMMINNCVLIHHFWSRIFIARTMPEALKRLKKFLNYVGIHFCNSISSFNLESQVCQSVARSINSEPPEHNKQEPKNSNKQEIKGCRCFWMQKYVFSPLTNHHYLWKSPIKNCKKLTRCSIW